MYYSRYKLPSANSNAGGPNDDPIPDYMNVLSMFCSMFGLMMKVRILSVIYNIKTDTFYV